MNRNEILQAIIDGKQLQVVYANGSCLDASHENVLRYLAYGKVNTSFRIKPEPRPDAVHRRLINGYCNDGWLPEMVYGAWRDNVVFTLDGETGELKEAAMIGKPSPNRMEALLREMHTAHAWRGKIDEVLNDLTK